MKNGFVKVCAATPDLKVADTIYNGDKIIEIIEECETKKVKLLVFPELCLTGYTCGDLFLQRILLNGAKEQLIRIVNKTKGKDMLVLIGLPYEVKGKLYNVAAVVQNGRVLGMVPKIHLPNYSEFYEARHFTSGNEEVQWISVEQEKEKIPFGTNLLFCCKNDVLKDMVLAVELCEDLWAPIPPSSYHALAGANIIANLSASDEVTGKDTYRKELVKGQSARLVSGYIYASSGEGESTTDLVFSAHNVIAENGVVLKESKRFKNECIISEIDVERLMNERRRMSTYPKKAEMDSKKEKNQYVEVEFFYQQIEKTKLTRGILQKPFVPNKKEDRDKRCDEILNIQALGLKKRLTHTKSKCAIIGLSGGLDSTLALLVIVKAFDMLQWNRENIVAITMPCFGTTDRTYQNAITLAGRLKVTLKEISIKESVLLHLKEIGHDVDNHDVTYENAQARMRTQVLMNVANQKNGMVIGTGDMSELALGWATYNGDHMSMYGVNASVPKTLVRYLVSYYAETTKDKELSNVLLDVLDTPVSPELLPPKDGAISQKTEDIVGPYELHDFYLYYMLRFGFLPSKIYRLAVLAFQDCYNKETILKWLQKFYWRFFSQQFKRSCLPDGPKVGSVAVSPRGDLRMPSDACVRIWIEDLETIEQDLD